MLSERGRVFTWGYDDDGRLGHGSFGHQVNEAGGRVNVLRG